MRNANKSLKIPRSAIVKNVGFLVKFYRNQEEEVTKKLYIPHNQTKFQETFQVTLKLDNAFLQKSYLKASDRQTDRQNSIPIRAGLVQPRRP